MKCVLFAFIVTLGFCAGTLAQPSPVCKPMISEWDPGLEMENIFSLKLGESCLMFPDKCRCWVDDREDATVTILPEQVKHKGHSYFVLKAIKKGETRGQQCRCAEPNYPSLAIGWGAVVS